MTKILLSKPIQVTRQTDILIYRDALYYEWGVWKVYLYSTCKDSKYLFILFNSFMDRLHMILVLKATSPSGLIVTRLTTIFNSFMYRFKLLLKVAFPICLIFTKLTTMFISIMDRHHMLLMVAFLSYLIVTEFTTIFISFADRLQMLLKLTFLSHLMVTKLTTIFNSIIDLLCMP